MKRFQKETESFRWIDETREHMPHTPFHSQIYITKNGVLSFYCIKCGSFPRGGIVVYFDFDLNLALSSSCWYRTTVVANFKFTVNSKFGICFFLFLINRVCILQRCRFTQNKMFYFSIEFFARINSNENVDTKLQYRLLFHQQKFSVKKEFCIFPLYSKLDVRSLLFQYTFRPWYSTFILGWIKVITSQGHCTWDCASFLSSWSIYYTMERKKKILCRVSFISFLRALL